MVTASTPVPAPGNTAGVDRSVTVIVARRIKPGFEHEFEGWASGVCAAAAAFHGYLGATLQRPQAAADEPYVLVFRFAGPEDLATWNASSERTLWLARAERMTREAPHMEVLTGMEHWFGYPSGASTPARHKMAVLTWLVIWPLAVVVPLLLSPLIAWWHPVIRTALATAIIVTMMTYVIMPRVMRLAGRWLFRR